MRVRHTMNAPMVFKDGRLWGVLGTPGADNQVQVNLQVLMAMAVFGARPAAGAGDAALDQQPARASAANYPHAGDAVLTLEAGLAGCRAPGWKRWATR